MSSTRLPLMESTDINSQSSPAPTDGARRRSGRVVKAPQKFIPDVSSSSKRKRNVDHDNDDVENEEPEDDEPTSDEDVDEDDDMDGDDEPAQPKKRKPSKKQSASQPKKRALKKPKTNGAALASGAHATSLPSRPKRTHRTYIARRDGSGIYAEVFGSGDSSDDVAGRWYANYLEDKTAAVTDLVNCVLLAAGCDLQVTEDDIQDPDNCQNRLADLQSVFQDQNITDYPLISRAKTSKSFRDLLIGFFKSLIDVLHQTEVLYTDGVLMENIARWVASMSSSTLRPFRHTATTVALAMETALVTVAKKLDDRVSKLALQLEAEKKGRGRNKEKSSAIQRSHDEAVKYREICGEQITDFFETVHVHRYRDVDPRIRTECVEALGNWIWILPTVFLEPQYLRYLGWMLSDLVPSARHEVLKQLARIFRRDAQRLSHFIERFRSRLIEMATKDSDVSVRCAAISVVETLRAAGMLEPDEMDTVGKLIFDTELRVRKAVVGFFISSLNDLIESKKEELGDENAIDELFSDDNEEDFSSPRKEWITIKCLAETLASYDAQLEEEQGVEPPHIFDIAADALIPAAPDTRISLASQVLYDKLDEVKSWEIISGYLLFDHTTSTAKSKSKSKANSLEAAFRKAVAPEAQEEPILLEVLSSAIKSSLAQLSVNERTKQKLSKAEAVEQQEETAVHLATAIPQLLRKFGAEPRTATVVLRLEQSLDLDVFQQLRQDSATYDKLLDEICTQFSRHVDRGVVSAAVSALLHARQYAELEELADGKLQVLWDSVLDSLRNFDKSTELSKRNSLEGPALKELANLFTKISGLASVSDCTSYLESKGKTDESRYPAIEMIIQTAHRGHLTMTDDDDDIADIEDEITSLAIKSCQFYFMWKVRGLFQVIRANGDISEQATDEIFSLKKSFQTALINTFSSRSNNDDARFFATGSLCDLHILFATLRSAIDSGEAADKYQGLKTLIGSIPSDLSPELISIFDGIERIYSRRSKRTLNDPGDDDEPVDDDQLSDDEDDDDGSPEHKKAMELYAERSLCQLTGKFVLAILAKVLDQHGPQAGTIKKRLLRNQTKLGPNYREIVLHLDEEKLKEAADARTRAQRSNASRAAAAPRGPERGRISEEIVVADDDDEENEEEDDPFADDEPEEGTLEDLKRRELLDDPIEEVEDDEEQAEGGRRAHDGLNEDDSVLGD